MADRSCRVTDDGRVIKSDGTPLLLAGKPIKVVPLQECFPCWFDEQGNPKPSTPYSKPKQLVYAIREGRTNNMKIGVSYDVEARLSALQIGATTRLSIEREEAS